jgi:TRAP-type C4-dicarboxylate transport system permease small subunit
VNKFIDKLEKIQRTFGSIMLVGLLIVVSLQVISRFIIKSPIQWTEEGSRFIFFWVALMGACVSVKTKKHFTISVYEPGNFRNKTIRLAAELIPDIIVLGFCILLTWYGWQYFTSGFTRRGIEVPLQMSWVYAALPVSGVTMALYTVNNILITIGNSRKSGEQ